MLVQVSLQHRLSWLANAIQSELEHGGKLVSEEVPSHKQWAQLSFTSAAFPTQGIFAAVCTHYCQGGREKEDKVSWKVGIEQGGKVDNFKFISIPLWKYLWCRWNFNGAVRERQHGNCGERMHCRKKLEKSCDFPKGRNNVCKEMYEIFLLAYLY